MVRSYLLGCFIFLFKVRCCRWIFQSVDQGVENFIEYVDNHVGAGHGHRVCITCEDRICCLFDVFLFFVKVLKLILLVAPVFVVVIFGAVSVLMQGDHAIFDNGKTSNFTI